MPYTTKQRRAVLQCLEDRASDALTPCEVAEELRRTVNTLLGIDEEISRKMREETIALLPGGEAELEKLLVHFPPAVRSVSAEPQHE